MVVVVVVVAVVMVVVVAVVTVVMVVVVVVVVVVAVVTVVMVVVVVAVVMVVVVVVAVVTVVMVVVVVCYKQVKTHPVLMPSSKHCKPSRELRRALKGALAMARDRGYVLSGDNQLLTPPPRDSKTFFRSFPAHFDVTDRLE
ncbi:hypothetical protein GWK47_037871 [Chionoecetes opilio]|uniref:Uncharacterized protein n=1 Tax=Chionoecetes opilio TaxID=41210 RepID=A0A8J4YEM6_CHIOP|nr:hypothetical protein GWK47_037871 [Chionoecetes opilio]